MMAAGVESLDLPNRDGTYRQEGLILIVDITYTNYAVGNVPTPNPDGGPPLGGTGWVNVFSEEVVKYTYRVFTVPNTGFLFQSSNGNLPPSVTAPANSASPERWYRRNFGNRIVYILHLTNNLPGAYKAKSVLLESTRHEYVLEMGKIMLFLYFFAILAIVAILVILAIVAILAIVELS
jgi:hypothetical protein